MYKQRRYTRRRNSNNNKENKVNTFLPHIVSVVTVILGTLMGSVLTNYYWEKQYDKQNTNNQTEIIVNKRVELIDKMTQIAAKNDMIQSEYDYLVELLKIQKLRVDNELYDPEFQKSLNDKDKETFKLVMDYRMEISSVKQLSVLYFGPKTKKLLLEMNKINSMWMTPKQENELLEAMSSELDYFPAKK